MRSRRSILGIGGAVLAGLLAPARASAGTLVEVMKGNTDGSNVWYDPIGLRIQPGQTIRWVNLDPGNTHTTTAYHPDNFNHQCRIPKAALPWNSDYLLPDETFAVTLPVEGVYDYFCVPHEHAGMVGRIIVGRPVVPAPDSAAFEGAEPIPQAALGAFPSVVEIMAKGVVRRG
jgi:plastocyanin